MRLTALCFVIQILHVYASCDSYSDLGFTCVQNCDVSVANIILKAAIKGQPPDKAKRWNEGSVSDCVLPDETCCLLGPLPALDSPFIIEGQQSPVDTESTDSTQPATSTEPAAGTQPETYTEPAAGTQPETYTESAASTQPTTETKLATVDEELANDETLSSSDNLESTNTPQFMDESPRATKTKHPTKDPVVELITSIERPEGPNNNFCGKRNENGLTETQHLNEITDGSKAKFGEWPHVCMILVKNSNGTYDYKNPASLVGRNVLITGAHNVKMLEDKGQDLLVRCGVWDREAHQDNYTRHHQDVEIEAMFMHSKFNPSNIQNNFGLILTKQSFNYTDHVSPICLPSADQDVETAVDCYTSGWGIMSLFSSGRKFSKTMKSLSITLVDHSKCQEQLRQTRLSEFFELHEKFLCGQARKKMNPCNGDGGGPLVCRDPKTNRYFQIGITSWGLNCDGILPDVYAFVPSAVCWIDETVTAYNQEHGTNFKIDGLSNMDTSCKR
eukprot:TRINITY_DN27281_c0_g1_i5.p1 TRINITY_DN27281_c0_g1~~TRINITY_DN27281_c0_g1_i5.p1  ORF type:complete len:502 (+),score=42.13 TRINITY_DN27281_c0_g1_i5:28-1533(+)